MTFGFCSAEFSQCIIAQHFGIAAMCCMLVTTAAAPRPILHAGNILINLDDDSASLDDDSSTLIRNEAIEPHDELERKEMCERMINEIIN